MKKLFLCFFIAISLCSFSFSAVLYKTNAVASFYGSEFHGKKTSNGEAFNMNDFTCAHKLLPFNTILRVTNLSNGKVVEVRVNDRGPFIVGREIDLSTAAAKKLDMIKEGTVKVKLEIVKMGANTKLSSQTSASAKKIMAKKGEILKNPLAEKKTEVKNPQELKDKKEWIIQVGSYSERENAIKTAKKLSKAGFKNIYLQTSKDVVRVIIKNVKTEMLEQTETKLQTYGFYDYIKK